MEKLTELIALHANNAHWFIFGAIILAGANFPISTDFVIIAAALLAAQVIPENTLHLFLSVYFGCLISAWVAYWIGRLLGPKLAAWRYFAKILKPEKLAKIKSFYEKYGLLTLILGRFIPFGVRNCIFMTTGISKTPFKKFVWRDLIACSLWSSTCFYLFYSLGQNYEALTQHVKSINLVIFIAFSVTVIGVIWYKKRKNTHSKTIEESQ